MANMTKEDRNKAWLLAVELVAEKEQQEQNWKMGIKKKDDDGNTEKRITFQDVADGAGVHRDTIHEWKKTDEFQQAVADLTDVKFRKITGKVKKMLTAALDAEMSHKDLLNYMKMILQMLGEDKPEKDLNVNVKITNMDDLSADVDSILNEVANL